MNPERLKVVAFEDAVAVAVALEREVLELRAAIQMHKAGLEARFVESGGDPNEHDVRLWSLVSGGRINA